jgi:branched-chain amino acid transport system permease protein
LINGIVVGGVYVLIAVGLTMVFGILNVVNFAHGDLYMVGAYLALFLVTIFKLPIWLSILAAVGVAALFGFVIERAIFRPIRFAPPHNAIIASMGLSYLLADGARIAFTPAPKMMPAAVEGVLEIGGLFVSHQRILILVVATVLITGLTLFVRYSWIGMAMRGVSQDKTASRLMGINLNRIAGVTMAISSGLAAAAGGLIGPLFVVEPSMGARLALKAFCVVVLGGVGNVSGAIGAGLLLGVAEAMTAGYVATGLKDLVAFVLLILALIVKPTGLFGGGAIQRD